MVTGGRRFVRLAVTLCFGLVAFASTAEAANNTGTITYINLTTNPVLAGRGVCIQMNPPISATDPWACLGLGSALYKETVAVLLLAAQTQKSCVVAYSVAPAGWGGVTNQIDIVQCPYP